jgi:hypothetical protein
MVRFAVLISLSPCNRVEIHDVTPKVNGNIRRLFQQLSTSEAGLAPHEHPNLSTREPGSGLAAWLNSRVKTRYPVDDALNLAALS